MMNKKRSALMTLAILGIAVAAIAVYRFHFRKSLPEAPLAVQVTTILNNNGCLACHAADAPKPFYHNFPVAGKLVKRHIRNGVRYIDLGKVCRRLQEGKPVSEVDIAKIEQSLVNGSMPLTEYKMVHWGTSYNNVEQDVLTRWILENRKSHYPQSLAAAEFAGEPVQPLPDSLPVHPGKVALGFKLYHDVRLSSDNTVSCATCHPLHKAGVDGLKTSKGIYGQIGGINAPTVYNAALNLSQFWDGRAKDLQVQAGGPPLDALEMGSSWEEIIGKLRADKELVKEFAGLYPEGITDFTVTDAIAEFEKTLLTPNSRFDRYLKGEKEALTAEEIEGYRLFKKYNCATCHTGANMGGQSYEYMGIVEDYFGHRGLPLHDNKDYGHFNVTKDSTDFQRFKTPGLRNIALTAPYLHDGSALTLEVATEVMFTYQMGKEVPKQDIGKLVLFMNTLTGENPMMSYIHPGLE